MKKIKVDDLHLESIDIMKIDVEGFEIDVLRGAGKTIKEHKPKIILETHSKDLKERSLKILKDLGYNLYHEGREVKPENSWMDSIQNLFLMCMD